MACLTVTMNGACSRSECLSACHACHTLCFSYFRTMNAASLEPAVLQLMHSETAHCSRLAFTPRRALPACCMCNCPLPSLLLATPFCAHLLLTINLKNEFPLKMPQSHRCVPCMCVCACVCLWHTYSLPLHCTYSPSLPLSLSIPFLAASAATLRQRHVTYVELSVVFNVLRVP